MTRLAFPGSFGGSFRHLVLLLFLGFFPLRAANEGPVVELPKFVVTDSRELPPPEHWRYATIPGFEILTNATDRTTQRLIADFELFRMALGVVWPISDRPAMPTSLILCAKGSGFDSFVPAGKTSAETARASVFLKGPERAAIVIDLASAVVNVLPSETDDPASGSDSSRIEVDHNKQLYREYVHYLLSKSEPRLPAWFEEGMSQIIMAMKVDPKFIEFGKLADPNAVSAQAALTAQLNSDAAADSPESVPLAGAPIEDLDFNAALHRKALVPLSTFFAIGHEAPEAVNVLGNNRWAKEAYAFVHLCLYGEHGKYRRPFSQFLSRILKGEEVTEALFQDCFHLSYKQMLLEIRSYIEFTVYEPMEYTAKGAGLPKPTPLALRDATPAEVGRIKGEALLLAGHAPEARTELIAPYIRGERDPQLLAALGLYEEANKEDERARKFLEAAASGRVERPRAYLELARLRYTEALAQPAGKNGKFSPAQTQAVVGPLLIARGQPPPTVGVYELLADSWVQSEAVAAPPEVAILIEGVRLFPGRLRLVYLTAALAADAGMAEAAGSLADHGIRYAPDPAVKARFEQLKAKLPAGAVPAAAGAKAPAGRTP